MSDDKARPALKAPARSRMRRVSAHQHVARAERTPHVTDHPLARPGLTGHTAPAKSEQPK